MAANKKIHVLFLQSLPVVGSETMIHGLIMKYLKREHQEVFVACNPGDLGVPSEAFTFFSKLPNIHFRATDFGPNIDGRSRSEIIRQLPRALTGLIDLTRLAWYVKRHHIDIIHCSEKRRDALYGVLIGRLTGVRSVVHLHLKYADWMGLLTQWAINHADGVICVSPFVVDSAKANGVREERLYCVLNSIEASHWDFQLDGSSVREEYSIAPDAPLVASISRLFPWKGQHHLLRALAAIKDRVPDCKVLIVGADDGHASGGRSYSTELRELAAELHIEQRVIFTGWRRDIDKILAACDIFAMPSFEEPFGVVFLEAMAMKRPVIALDNGGTPSAVQHGRDGLLSEPEDIQQLGENLLTLLTNPALRKEMGEHGRKRVEEYYIPQRLADEVQWVYRRVLGREQNAG